jgi:hypothetical protein
VAACRDALRQGGVLAVWSAHHDDAYLERLEKAGLDAEARVVPARGELGGLKHVIFLGVKRGPGRGKPGAAAPEAGRKAGGKSPGGRRRTGGAR